MECIHSCNQRPALEASDHNYLIEEFAARTAQAATSNKAVSERLRWEILDHLTEVATETGHCSEASAKRAIEQFGATECFAHEYRTTIMEVRMQNMRSTALYALIAVFASMRLRNFFLELGWRDNLGSTRWGELLLLVDRYAFAIAAVLLSIGWLARSNILPLRRSFGSRRDGILLKGDLLTTAAPSILLLLSGFAIIGSIFVVAGPTIINTTYDIGAFTFATLVLVCVVISAQLAYLARACMDISVRRAT